MSGILRIAVLGSTGSIGTQTLQVAQRFPERLRVVALSTRSNVQLLSQQAASFDVARVAVADPTSAEKARGLGLDPGVGPDAVAELAAHPDVDVVVNALVGFAGLRASIAALEAGKRLALANKESLVAGGELLTRLVRDWNLLPVDSEHSAVFQCLLGESRDEVAKIWLTASGGPFHGMTRAQLSEVTVEQALEHPTWSMGPKITIDSATLMNKGLEVIEAHHLFGIAYDDIRIAVHPQSCVHSMVEFRDGSVKAHLGATDMRIPIQYALSYPNRWSAPVPALDFTRSAPLGFGAPDPDTFRCLALALEAGRAGGTMPAAMNAANEVAVSAFLAGTSRLTDVDRVVETVMSRHVSQPLESVEQLERIDAWARETASAVIAGA